MIGHLVEKDAIVEPRNLGSNLLHNFAVWPNGGESTHVPEVARRETPQVRERLPQVVRKPVDSFGPPAFLLLATEDRFADIPVQQHHRLVSSRYHAQPLRADAFLDLPEQDSIVGGQLALSRGRGKRRTLSLSANGLPARILGTRSVLRHIPNSSKFSLIVAANVAASALSSSSSS